MRHDGRRRGKRSRLRERGGADSGYRNPAAGLTVEGHGRGLLIHRGTLRRMSRCHAGAGRADRAQGRRAAGCR